MDQDDRLNLWDRVKNLGFVSDDTAFTDLAFDIFKYQSQNNKTYKEWIGHFNHNYASIFEFPRIHISAFKTISVVTGIGPFTKVFTSSGTSQTIPAKHYVVNESDYVENAIKGFSKAYGSPSDYCILGLLPAYMEREGSSLVSMVNEFISLSSYAQSGTYLYDHDALYSTLISCKAAGTPTLLIGVSFALLDFIEDYQINFPELIVMETGGMKGRKKEITREELHSKLKPSFGVENIHSEYGMTELLSQAYSKGRGIYKPSHTMKVFVTEINDPLTLAPERKKGIINIIDLANIDSCAFIMTEDIGVCHADGSFEVLGRLDASDIRGCSLMVVDLK